MALTVEDVPVVHDGTPYVRVRSGDVTIDFPLTSEGAVGNGLPVVRPAGAEAPVSDAKRAAIGHRFILSRNGPED